MKKVNTTEIRKILENKKPKTIEELNRWFILFPKTLYNTDFRLMNFCIEYDDNNQLNIGYKLIDTNDFQISIYGTELNNVLFGLLLLLIELELIPYDIVMEILN